MPEKNIVDYILGLASKYDISYTPCSVDRFADIITSLTGDEVKHDPIEDMLVALKKEGKLSLGQVAILSVRYQRERHGNL